MDWSSIWFDGRAYGDSPLLRDEKTNKQYHGQKSKSAHIPP